MAENMTDSQQEVTVPSSAASAGPPPRIPKPHSLRHTNSSGGVLVPANSSGSGRHNHHHHHHNSHHHQHDGHSHHSSQPHVIHRTTSESLRLSIDGSGGSSSNASTSGVGTTTSTSLSNSSGGRSSANSGSSIGSTASGGGGVDQHDQQPKNSSYQITSITIVKSSKYSSDNGEDSADDLDESHADDSSRVTDFDNETPSFSEETFSKEDVFYSNNVLNSAPVIPTSSQYGLVIVDPNMGNSNTVDGAIMGGGGNGGNGLAAAQNQAKQFQVSISETDVNIMPTSGVGANATTVGAMASAASAGGLDGCNVKPADKKPMRSDRFKVVKIESTEPFRRGRWTCMDYLDHSVLGKEMARNSTFNVPGDNATNSSNDNSQSSQNSQTKAASEITKTEKFKDTGGGKPPDPVQPAQTYPHLTSTAPPGLTAVTSSTGQTIQQQQQPINVPLTQQQHAQIIAHIQNVAASQQPQQQQQQTTQPQSINIPLSQFQQQVVAAQSFPQAQLQQAIAVSQQQQQQQPQYQNPQTTYIQQGQSQPIQYYIQTTAAIPQQMQQIPGNISIQNGIPANLIPQQMQGQPSIVQIPVSVPISGLTNQQAVQMMHQQQQQQPIQSQSAPPTQLNVEQFMQQQAPQSYATVPMSVGNNVVNQPQLQPITVAASIGGQTQQQQQQQPQQQHQQQPYITQQPQPVYQQQQQPIMQQQQQPLIQQQQQPVMQEQPNVLQQQQQAPQTQQQPQQPAVQQQQPSVNVQQQQNPIVQQQQPRQPQSAPVNVAQPQQPQNQSQPSSTVVSPSGNAPSEQAAAIASQNQQATVPTVNNQQQQTPQTAPATLQIQPQQQQTTKANNPGTNQVQTMEAAATAVVRAAAQEVVVGESITSTLSQALGSSGSNIRSSAYKKSLAAIADKNRTIDETDIFYDIIEEPTYPHCHYSQNLVNPNKDEIKQVISQQRVTVAADVAPQENIFTNLALGNFNSQSSYAPAGFQSCYGSPMEILQLPTRQSNLNSPSQSYETPVKFVYQSNFEVKPNLPIQRLSSERTSSNSSLASTDQQDAYEVRRGVAIPRPQKMDSCGYPYTGCSPGGLFSDSTPPSPGIYHPISNLARNQQQNLNTYSSSVGTANPSSQQFGIRNLPPAARRSSIGAVMTVGPSNAIPSDIVLRRSASPQPQQQLSTTSARGANSNSASGASAVAIDNKIEQAMDLVKSHLMIAVREEVEVLKEKIAELMDRINQLESENTILKANVPQEKLTQLTLPSSGTVPRPIQNTNTSNGPTS